MGRFYLGSDLCDLREIPVIGFRKRSEKIAAQQTRVGICCGDACKAKHDAAGTWNYSLLFKIDGLDRWRCDGCYQAECGARHYLAAQMVPL